MKYEYEMEIDVKKCVRALIKKSWFIVIMAFLCGIGGAVVTQGKGEDIYTANASVYCTSLGNYSNLQMGISAMNDYSDIATSMKVCERAALLMGRADVDGTVVKKATKVITQKDSSATTALTQTDSSIIEISSATNDPVLSMEMSQAVAEAFMIEMENILGTDGIKMLDKPYSYEITFDAIQFRWKIRVLAVIGGALLAMMIIVGAELFDTKTTTIRECSLGEELSILGIIPRIKE